MPWRKGTLKPFRSVGSVSAEESAAAHSDVAGSSVDGLSNLFGSSNPGCNWHFSGFENFSTVQPLKSPSHEFAHSDVAGGAAPLSKQQFDKFLGHSFLSVVQASDLKMPWEKGIFKQIFEEASLQPSFNMSWFPRVQAVDDAPDATVQELAAAANRRLVGEDPIYSRAISCISDVDHSAQLGKLQMIACNKWLSILLVCLHDSDVGRNIALLGPIETYHIEALNILEAVIGVRSFHTAICRANAVLRFLRETL